MTQQTDPVPAPGAIEQTLWRAGRRGALLLALAACLPAAALAQAGGEPLLGSPLGTPAPMPKKARPQPAPPGGGAPGLPLGTGPGYHDPRSPYKPLQDREGVVRWSLLSAVSTKQVKNRVQPIFPAPVKALHGQTVKVQGFMMPLEPGERQRHFLLSAVPTTCAFCVPAGPEGLVEVRTVTPVRYGTEPVLVEGRLDVLDNDPYGVYYRVSDARPVE